MGSNIWVEVVHLLLYSSQDLKFCKCYITYSHFCHYSDLHHNDIYKIEAGTFQQLVALRSL